MCSSPLWYLANSVHRLWLFGHIRHSHSFHTYTVAFFPYTMHVHAHTRTFPPHTHTTNEPMDFSNILPANITSECNCFQTYHLPVITGLSFLLKPFPRPVFGSCSFSVSLEPQFIRNAYPSSSVLHPLSIYGQFSLNIKIS